jgi:hypothetical protein
VKGKQEIWDREGLHEVGIRAVTPRVDSRLGRPVRGHHDDRQGGMYRLAPCEELDSVHARQAVVSEKQVNPAPIQNSESVLPAGHGDNLAPGGLQRPLQRTPKNFVVLDNQNANAHLPLSHQVSTHSDGERRTRYTADPNVSCLKWQTRQMGCRDTGEAKCLTV